MPLLRPALVALPLAAALAVSPTAVMAQYKIIDADGKVTYTDREPTAVGRKVTALNARAPSQVSETDTALPFELRQVASKYPVTLYTTTGNCEPCATARQLLKQRGVPYTERQVLTAEDGDALEKLSGAREAPTLAIGSQTLRGLASEVWNSYLDAAGYPRESKLPASYQYKPATSIVDRKEAAQLPTTAAASPSASVERPAAALPSSPGGIRF